jgi:predicted esterase YcpF (UPF0227 family)
MILYIHGFGSSGVGGKATLLSNEFGDEIITPTLSYVPALALHTLEQLIELCLQKQQKVHLIGSSLGGYYALYLANKYELKAVLINPAMTPFKTLDKIGMATNYFDLSSFEVTQEHLCMLKEYEVKEMNKAENILLLLQTGDELLDYKQALEKLPKAKAVVQEGGNHSFENFESCFETIKSFLEMAEK